MKKFYFIQTAFLSLLLCNCVVGFRNAEQTVPSELRWIYVPSATDSSSLGGAAARISNAVRYALSLNTNMQLVALEDARVALEIQIREQHRNPAGKVVDCEASTTGSSDTIGSKAFECSKLGIAQATLAAESEAISMYAVANVVDLNNGKIVLSRNYQIAKVHPTISDDESDRNAIRARRDLHSLRYLEQHDNAVSALGDTIARDIAATLGSIQLGEPQPLETTQ